MIPISKQNLQPTIKSNISYVNSIDEFEKIKLEPNEIAIRFDNFNPCFYMRKCDKDGNYSDIDIYFYDPFDTKLKSIERQMFEQKCRDAGLNKIKTLIAYMYFVENKKPKEIWEYLLINKIADYSWDYVRNLRGILRKKLFLNEIKS